MKKLEKDIIATLRERLTNHGHIPTLVYNSIVGDNSRRTQKFWEAVSKLGTWHEGVNGGLYSFDNPPRNNSRYFN